MARTALYRHFDAEGRLLYVGISDCLSARDKQHAATAKWHGDVVRTEAEWLNSRDDAVLAEARAITREKPTHNVHWIADGDKAAVRQIVGELGAEVICRKLGVTRHSVRFAVSAGSFSANWFAGLLELCIEAGVDCPMHIFNWKTAQACEAA